ncbi:sigma-70 family RNA polymerase sigma factor [Amycolatopsis aidingensis]|uniref:sigma-70 family RNA polymerase sigma factor n=1 Tax=Amycolatopsis aidingensis TaxID=2842453 RepID=UPI001C0D65F9|nr:sigma-70 family RNA polymerase sigma factor [Amycolatopsis aidingensis]
MSTVPADLSGHSDAELIASVRGGELAAYGTLYERHVSAAYNLARQLARSAAEADDLVSDAFSKVLETLRAGKGPDTAFRAYLLTALRHTAYDKTRKDRRVDLNEDMSEVGGSAAAEALTVPFSDTALAGLERTLAAKAFARLPERWQAVLWHTEIEQQSPAEVAPLLGLTANGVSALAYRAREGLRQAYLQVHLAETTAARCRATADRLGAWTRDGLSKRERAQVETHLDECDQCRTLAAELADVNGALRSVVAPLVLGGAVLGYLSLTGAAKASAATAAAAGAAAAGAGAAGGSGGAGAAAGAAAAGPRQFLGVAASGVALAAAVALGLAAGGGDQEIPAAAQQPTAQAPAPEEPEQQPPPPPEPEVPPAPEDEPPQPDPPPEDEPVPPPAEPAPSPVPPPSAPTTTTPPPESPAPEPPSLTAQPSGSDIELSPGETTELPITVRNEGGSTSEPISATLSLPPGVHAVDAARGAGGGGGAPRLLEGPALRQPGGDPGTVPCPGSDGTRTVTCSTEEGLEPGESVVLLFRLVATEDAKPGAVSGTVSAGTELSVSVQVRVTVPQDAVDLAVRPVWNPLFPWLRHPVLDIEVTNKGPAARPVTIEVDRPGHLLLGGWRVDCDRGGSGMTCTSHGELEPGQRLSIWVGLDRRPTTEHQDRVTVTAILGSATASKSVQIGCWGLPCHWPGRQPVSAEEPTTGPPSGTGPTGTPGPTSAPGPTGTPGPTGPGTGPTGTPGTGPGTTRPPSSTKTPERTPAPPTTAPSDSSSSAPDRPGPPGPPGRSGKPVLPWLPWLW